MAYRLLAWFLRTITRVFFRQIEIVGLEHVPTTGPVLFAGNHPNSLIDPILIITTCGRKVHFAAKAQLFAGRLMRTVLRGLGAVPIKRRDEHDGAPLMATVRSHQDRLDELGITDRELARDLSKLEVVARVVRHLVLLAFWLPLALPGAPMHVLPLAFGRFASGKLTPRKDVVATTKLLIGLLLVLLGYAVAIAFAAATLGPRAALALAVLLPLSGWATLRVLDRGRLVRRGLGVLFRRLAFRREVQSLRGERVRLVELVIATVAAVKPAGLAALFPPDHPGRLGDKVAM